MNAPVLHLQQSVEDVSFRADVAMLKGTLFRPPGRPKAAVVLHGATGVPARYYRHFARWLAEEQGVACLTYDYRDFGASTTRHPSASDATLADWGLRDQPAAQRALEARVPGVPVWVVGHSIGGLMLPFHEGARRVSRLITVAAGPVHLSDHPGRWWALARFFWFGPAPVITRTLGYLPGRLLGLGANLPAGVYRQWRRWCTTPGFWLGDVGSTLPMPDCTAFEGDLRIVAVADDGMVPPRAVWRLMQLYPEAWKRQTVLKPDRGPIGHIAVFAPRNMAHWPQIMG